MRRRYIRRYQTVLDIVRYHENVECRPSSTCMPSTLEAGGGGSLNIDSELSSSPASLVPPWDSESE